MHISLMICLPPPLVSLFKDLEIVIRSVLHIQPMLSVLREAPIGLPFYDIVAPGPG